jgi:hypothetical protein
LAQIYVEQSHIETSLLYLELNETMTHDEICEMSHPLFDWDIVITKDNIQDAIYVCEYWGFKSVPNSLFIANVH